VAAPGAANAEQNDVIEDAMLYLAAFVAVCGLIAWVLNLFTISVPAVLRNLFVMVVLGWLVFILILFVRET